MLNTHTTAGSRCRTFNLLLWRGTIPLLFQKCPHNAFFLYSDTYILYSIYTLHYFLYNSVQEFSNDRILSFWVPIWSFAFLRVNIKIQFLFANGYFTSAWVSSPRDFHKYNQNLSYSRLNQLTRMLLVYPITN